jgi:hypothetical protein
MEHDYSHVVRHGGHSYLATGPMARIFAAKADDLIDRGETELVPLLHSHGVDMLVVGPGVRYRLETVTRVSTHEKDPAGGAAGPSLPDLDSNQEPAG